MFKQIIRSSLKEIVGKEIELEVPPNPEMGDYAFPCFSLSKEWKKSPPDIANEIKERLSIEGVEIKTTGPYINFFLDKAQFTQDILTSKHENHKTDETIVIDYSGPNVAKHMGVHNLRSTVIGNALYKIYSHLGYRVVGVNHIGDWGTNFGQLIVGIKHYAKLEDVKTVKDLNNVYVTFHEEAEKHETLHEQAREEFKKLEDGDEEARKYWQLFVDVSLADYKRIYERLHITFDSWRGEESYIPLLDKTFKALDEENLVEEDDGAMVVQMGEDIPPCLLKKSDGGSLYGLRDIAAGMFRLEEYKPKKILYVVDIAQTLHFKQWFKVMEKLSKKNTPIFEHVVFGRLSFEDGAMSTRKGKVVILEDVLDKARDKIFEIIVKKNPDLQNKDEVAEQVGVGAIIFHDLVNDRVHDITFTWDTVLDFQGDAGPYVQYTYARCSAVLRKAEKKDVDFSLVNDVEYQLVKELAKFDSVLKDCVKDNKPSHLAKYLIKVCREFNNFYAHDKIITDGPETNLRILIVEKTRSILGQGLELLGIEHPEEM